MKQSISTKNNPFVSIIIPTYNEEKNIARLLNSIQQQQYQRKEIVLVDQSSDDDTVQIAKKYHCKIISLPKPRFYSPPGNNRNVGAGKAKGEILLHLDADMELPDNAFLERLILLFDSVHQAIIIHEKDVAAGFWNKCKALERRCYWDNVNMQGARAVTKALFLKVGGYDSKISSGEDFYINNAYKSHTHIALSNDVYLYHHTGHISLQRLLVKKYNYGKTATLYLSKLQQQGKNESKRIIVDSLRSYMKNIKYLFSDPFHFIGIFVLRFFEYIALRLGMLKAKAKTSQ